ncbi:DUF3472 domain-containing protein [Spirosoma agri]|uniref:DUF5077 domain-containing protein n=1 Tax=Spirosoma agri TaxID=1987381 RepID=A0A6M0IJN7_9BACT|nr:DUF5077 domain-containing protein [Spirosoma agri]NEU68498.1 DUF5077 domain-containing protein [Spirosoma agri]
MRFGFFPLLYVCALSLTASHLTKPTVATQAFSLSTATDTTRTIALAGNAFITKPVPGGTEVITKQGLKKWTDPESVTSVYFRVGTAGKLTVSLRAKVTSGSSRIKVTINDKPFIINLTSADKQPVPVGSVTIRRPGYIKVDLQGISKTGDSFGDVSDLLIASSVADVVFATDPANYYWSRRGPSVHLKYTPPSGTNVEWFYNELTVPPGEDKIGSYYMANGFTGGYFGIQVNSPTERRVLFSVWDPSDGKTTLVRKGANVTDNGFDGEGTGGQSYLRYNWQAGTSYKFLTQGKPDGSGNTLFSSWFYAPEVGHWQFMATWKKPNTSTYLTGLYSFLENFIDNVGYTERKAFYTNQWVRSSAGAWTELTTATFTGDATAKNRQRLDYAGGVEQGQFFLRNGGFFAQPVPLNTPFNRSATGQPPAIDLNKLPEVQP